MKMLINFNTQKGKRRLFEYLKTLRGEHWVSLDRETRSQTQNKYYWGVVVHLIADGTGMDKQEVHHELKKRFLPVFFRDRYKRKEVIEGGGTAELTIDKFQQYVELCKAFAILELDIYIPDPNEVMDL